MVGVIFRPYGQKLSVTIHYFPSVRTVIYKNFTNYYTWFPSLRTEINCNNSGRKFTAKFRYFPCCGEDPLWWCWCCWYPEKASSSLCKFQPQQGLVLPVRKKVAYGVLVIMLHRSPNISVETHGTQSFESTMLASKYCVDTANCNCVA